MNSRRNRAAAGILIVALVAGACGSSKAAAPSSPSASTGPTTTFSGNNGGATDVGVTPTQITVGQTDILSGPVPGLFQGAKFGTQAYFNYINSQGGVYGRQIKLDVGDDAFNGATNRTLTQAQIKNDFALVGGYSLFDGAPVDLINAAKMPDITDALDSTRRASPYNFSVQPQTPGGWLLGPFDYYKQKDPAATQHVATLVADVASARATQDAMVAAMKADGYKIAYSRVVGVLETDFTADVVKMRQAGVQMVVISGLDIGGVSRLLAGMAQQGFKPKVFSSTGTAYDSTLIQRAGAAAAEGIFIDMTQSLYLGEDASKVPAVKVFDDWMRKTNPNVRIDLFSLFGWTSAELFTDALKAAGPRATRTGLLAALHKITSFTANGLLPAANPGAKTPPTCWLHVQVHNGKFQRVDDPATGFRCNDHNYHQS